MATATATRHAPARDLRQQLQHDRTALQARLDQIGAAAAEPADTAGDAGDLSLADIERQQLHAVATDTRRRIYDIDQALGRIDAGTYGDCVVCGGVIPTERLEVRPATDRCVGCMTATR